MRASREHWNAIAKPIAGLGALEDVVVQLAGISGTPRVDVGKRAVVAFCADNGVVAEGVTQTGQEVTRLVAQNMVRHASSVCIMGAPFNVDVVPVDVGMASPVEGVLDRRIAAGTKSIARGPAMTRDQALRAVEVGIEIAGLMQGRGYGLLIAAEMGIGNTTTSSAVISSLLALDPKDVVGRGAGLDSAGLARKVDAVSRALEVNAPDASDALDVVAKVGGFDIAALAGLFIGGAARHVPVLIDGLISAVGALVAVRLCPACRPYLVATHASAEPAFGFVMKELGLKPVLHAGMHLGEGTGAVCFVPVLDAALALYANAASFDVWGMDAYEVDLA